MPDQVYPQEVGPSIGNGRPPTTATDASAGADRPPPNGRPVFRYVSGWQALIPAVLKAPRQWVLWRYEIRQGRWTKVPYRPRNPRRKAQTDNPETWGTFDEALAAFLASDGYFDGIGFVFSASDPFTGFDLDGAIEPDGSVSAWARPILDRLSPCYAEISPSGRGLKGFVRAKLPGKGIRRTKFGPDGKGAVEVYFDTRFFTATGRPLDAAHTEIGDQDRSESVASLYLELTAPRKRKVKPKTTKPKTAGPASGPLDDDEIIRKARAAQNGAKFTALFDRGDAAGYGSASEADFALLGVLAFWTQDAAQLDRLFRRSALMRDKWDEARGDTTYGGMTIANALAGVTETYSALKRSANGDGQRGKEDSSQEPPDTRADIYLTADLHEAVDQAAAALAGHQDVYERGGALVAVHRKDHDDPEGKAGVKRSAGAPVIITLTTVQARTLLSRLTRFWSYDRREKQWVRKAPTKDVAEAVLGLHDIPGSRELTGVIEAPTLRPDGSLLVKPGYDEQSGLLYVPNADYPAVPENPSLEDVTRAAADLYLPVVDFPFRDKTDKASWLALVLTLIARGAIAGPVPAWLITANVAGSGKTILVTTAARIASGRPPAFDGYAADDAEMEKRLSCVAIAGDLLLLLDNAPNGGSVGGPALDRAILADGIFRARILGKTELTPDVPWRAVIAVTGNNLGTKDDALRRFIPCFLLSPLERPETRDPANYAVTRETGLSLDQYVLRERPRLVAAALTILRGYVAAGRPQGRNKDGTILTPMDFPKWDAVVRQAVFHTIGVDPAGSRGNLQANDETTLERHRVVEAWKGLCDSLNKSGGMTARAAAEEVNEAFPATKYNGFREAFPQAVIPKTDKIDSAKLGYILRRHRDAVTPYGTLTENGSEHHTVKWAVKGP